jgi:hypothetical protein
VTSKVHLQSVYPCMGYMEFLTLCVSFIFIIQKPMQRMGRVTDVKNAVICSACDGDRGEACFEVCETLHCVTTHTCHAHMQPLNSELQTPYFLFCTLSYPYKVSKLSTITPYTIGPLTLLRSLLVVLFLSKLLCYLHTISLLTSLPCSHCIH